MFLCEYESMSFALTVQNLIDAMQLPGCPLCRIVRGESIRWLDSVLWEYVNDPVFRETIEKSLGFCPSHTMLFFSPELRSNSKVLGINIIYEYLSRLISRKLRTAPNKNTGGLKNSFHRIRNRVSLSDTLSASEPCPICVLIEQTAIHVLADLFEELDHQPSDIQQMYQMSDGLCMFHLRLGFEQFSNKYIFASQWLLENALARLESQSNLMLEYIRKSNWECQNEIITVAEQDAWKQTLTFFCGNPAADFTVKG